MTISRYHGPGQCDEAIVRCTRESECSRRLRGGGVGGVGAGLAWVGMWWIREPANCPRGGAGQHQCGTICRGLHVSTDPAQASADPRRRRCIPGPARLLDRGTFEDGAPAARREQAAVRAGTVRRSYRAAGVAGDRRADDLPGASRTGCMTGSCKLFCQDRREHQLRWTCSQARRSGRRDRCVAAQRTAFPPGAFESSIDGIS